MVGSILTQVSALLAFIASALGMFFPKLVTRGTVLRLVCIAVVGLAIVFGAAGIWIGASEAQANQTQLDNIERLLREAEERRAEASGVGLVAGTLATAGVASKKISAWSWAFIIAVIWAALTVAYYFFVVRA